ncbi:Sporulation integral membrane protein YlbJ [compost metagenome]
MAVGYAHGLGTLIEPFTRRILGLPGTLGWVLPLGMTAGFPAAAEAAAELYKQGRITAREAEKLASFAHYCSPVLLVIVVGTGFLGQPGIGLLLLGIHWASGLSAAVTMNWLISGRVQNRIAFNSKIKPDVQFTSSPPVSRWRLALRNMEEARREDGRGFGKLLGDSVSSGVQTLMSTGGYMLIFAVIIHISSSLLVPIVSPDLASTPIAALLEVHLGSHAISKLTLATPIPFALAGATLGWSGTCAYLQARAALKPTGLSGAFFLINRIVHGAYAYVLTLLLWNPLSSLLSHSSPAYQDINGAAAWANGELPSPNWRVLLSVISWQFCILGLLIIIILFTAFIWERHIKKKSVS